MSRLYRSAVLKQRHGASVKRLVAKGTYLICHMMHRRYLAGIFVKLHYLSDFAQKGKAQNFIQILNSKTA